MEKHVREEIILMAGNLPLPPHHSIFQRAVIVLSSGSLLSHVRFDFDHGIISKLLHGINRVGRVARPVDMSLVSRAGSRTG